ncbi:E3 ubiquitin-protein ligase arih1 [Ceratocystis fimbriata CBS 114723]|uniref:RBR-type E3 ubiquitin transferase n=1 Tax=Ceratocystis fimbriata CBS 114723 TaxID=1035309 RepID=A0A2C5WUG4_9PEZI|nr:E3 ubiquitin-protein ligase arih1 [Ceratocystis fimbriata CBS 114723]
MSGVAIRHHLLVGSESPFNAGRSQGDSLIPSPAIHAHYPAHLSNSRSSRRFHPQVASRRMTSTRSRQTPPGFRNSRQLMHSKTAANPKKSSQRTEYQPQHNKTPTSSSQNSRRQNDVYASKLCPFEKVKLAHPHKNRAIIWALGYLSMSLDTKRKAHAASSLKPPPIHHGSHKENLDPTEDINPNHHHLRYHGQPSGSSYHYLHNQFYHHQHHYPFPNCSSAQAIQDGDTNWLCWPQAPVALEFPRRLASGLKSPEMASVHFSHLGSWSPDEITKEDLIGYLSLDQESRHAVIQASRTPAGDPASVLEISPCAACHTDCLIKNENTNRATAWDAFDEFPSETTRCCDSLVCMRCVRRSIKQSFHRHYKMYHWTALEAPGVVFKCPLRCHVSRDEQRRPYGSRELKQMLDDGSDGMKSYTDRFDRANRLRQTLSSVTPRLGSAELEEIKGVYQELVDLNLAHDPGCRRLTDTTLDQHSVLGHVEALEPIKIYRFLRNGRRVRIPIFLRYLNRIETRSCWICMDEIRDMSTGDSWEAWKDIWTALGNDSVAFKVLSFPLRLQKRCGHDIDFCKDCLGQHIQIEIRDKATEALGNIKCPSQGCKRTLRLAEIELYAPPDVKARYYDLMNTAHYSDDPDFMWCVNGDCQYGQIHPPNATKVQCSRCSQVMCFHHRGPWHQGQTCAQNDARTDTATDEWLQDNTKPCPKCQTPIEKNGGCYHMTCSSCRFEFCWDCLCDWVYANFNLQRHRPSCRFRQAGIYPTEAVGGLDVEAAIRDVAEIRSANPNVFNNELHPRW